MLNLNLWTSLDTDQHHLYFQSLAHHISMIKRAILVPQFWNIIREKLFLRWKNRVLNGTTGRNNFALISHEDQTPIPFVCNSPLPEVLELLFLKSQHILPSHLKDNTLRKTGLKIIHCILISKTMGWIRMSQWIIPCLVDLICFKDIDGYLHSERDLIILFIFKGHLWPTYDPSEG